MKFPSFGFLKKPIPAAVEASAESLPQSEESWSISSSLYRLKDYLTYNPDQLIGKKGAHIYKKMMNDEQVKAVVKFKRDAITSRDFYFELEADEYGISKEEAKRRIELYEEMIEKMDGSFVDVLNNILSAIYNGFSMNEKTFRTFKFKNATWWGIKRIRVKPFDTFYFKLDDWGDMKKLIQKMGPKEQELDIKRFIHFVVNPDVDEYYGQSELKEAYRAWFSKDMIIKFRNIYLERHAGGFRWVQPKEGKTLVKGSREYNDLKAVMGSMQSSTGAIFTGNVDFNSDYPQNNVAFKEAIDDCDLAIAKALLVPNLMGITPSGQTGSYSQSDTQLEAFFWTLDSDAARLEDALNEQLFKELGLANFGDEAIPCFRFKAASEKKKIEIIKIWSELTKNGAVKPSEADDKHLREMMDFPEPPDPKDGTATVTRPDSSLNGQQVSAMVDVLTKVAHESLSPESAEEILVASFPITREQAKAMLAKIPEPKTPPALPPGQQPPVPGQDPNQPPQNQPPAPGQTQPPQNQPQPGQQSNHPEETIVGKNLVTVSAFKKAIQRVDFAVIAKTSEDMELASVSQLSDVTGRMLDDIAQQVKEMKLNKASNANDLKSLKFNNQLVSKLRRRIRKVLSDAWKLGQKHAQTEISQAKKEFVRVNDDRMEFISAEYFDAKSFSITGNLTADMLDFIKNTILLGMKKDWTVQEVIDAIYRAAVSKGVISLDDAKQALGEALQTANPDARLKTIVRTSGFEAINEARFSYFRDPGLDGFVEAFRYSAIMDGRTTTICQHLDGMTHSMDWDQWSDYNPPNHFNCRSILIPITMIDTWSESNDPTVEPNAGFVRYDS